MNHRNSSLRILSLATSALCAAAHAQTSPTELEQAKQVAATLTQQSAALSPVSTQDPETIALLKALAKQIADLNQRLDRLETEVHSVHATSDKQTKDLSALTDAAKKTAINGFIHFQYRNNNLSTNDQHAFAVRNARLNLVETLDPKTSLKLSVDFATGTNQNNAALRDAYMNFQIRPSKTGVGSLLIAGQQSFPLGYELERSDSVREFPERANYNAVLFPAERGRGVQFRQEVRKGDYFHVGGWDALAINDREQSSLAAGPHGAMSATAGFRHSDKALEFSIDGLLGQRPSAAAAGSNPALPSVNRNYLYGDVVWKGAFDKHLTVRAEGFLGHDRVPTLAYTGSNLIGSDLAGAHMVATYQFNYRNQLSTRFEMFDMQRGTAGNRLQGVGLAYGYVINSYARLTASQEQFWDGTATGSGNRAFSVSTVRLEYRF